ncbi:MAG: bifunctional diaminohydroxyphosphoribosylaminopyrimidine deaminase/5-amino-6-(5-phosphoribosylamino)uracil reductase RibD [Bacteroidetes bacterium]|nr:bifunctional diaminohydroxyphosphoribosylaminopyrimidine deaminase/5-amino-6-(5-phosphoribosylamino)uracil reductase RibD [Bacteroidota bacterium]
MSDHELYMRRCFQLALQGKGFVAPNPLVGSVIVHDHKIIGEGYHMKYGEAHAEVNAVKSVADQSLLQASTLYVNLEPCAHHGKTPPCADLIVANKIPRVVIGCVDSFSEVAGKGIAKLRAAGIDVTVGVLEKESRELNARFFTFHEKKRPYVILKWAQSSDGFIDITRQKNQPHSKGIVWITEPTTKTLVHQWRHEEAAIMVGWKTVANDNPNLTCREIVGKNPVRIVIDADLRLDYNAFHLGDRKAKTIVLTAKNVTGDENLQFISPADFSVNSILSKLWQLNLQSVIVEGGRTTLQHFMDSKTWNEARILTGQKKLTDGSTAPNIEGLTTASYYFGNDHVHILKNG